MTLASVRAVVRALEYAGVSYWITVVDNASEDGSFERLQAQIGPSDVPSPRSSASGQGRRVEVIASGRNGGFGFGNNVGIRRGLASTEPAEYFYLLNSDAFPAEDAVKVLIDFMDAHPAVGLAGSYIHGVDDVPHETAFRFPSLQGELVERVSFGPLTRWLDDYVVALPIPTDTVRVDWLAGASMMIRRKVFDAVGLFDETFFLYYEEVDLCRRALLKGWPTYYVPASRVAHVGSASTGMKDRSRRLPGFYLDSRAYYFRKSHGAAYLAGANAAWISGQLVRLLRSRIERKSFDDPPSLLGDFLRHAAGMNRAE